MNKRAAIYILFGVTLIAGTAGMMVTMRGMIRELAYSINKPAVPEAVAYIPSVQEQSSGTVAVKVPANTDLQGSKVTQDTNLPAEINLAVPFLLQAPKQNWVQPFEDACEEASLLMVDAFYDGKQSNFTPDEGIETIREVAAYEDKTYGYNKDTNVDEVKKTAMNFFGYKNVEVLEATEKNIKLSLAAGYPVIAPAYGKALKNPNFRNGGPEYHMLVIKGYKKDGQWITNDPGTRRGENYVYPKQRLLDAIHDFNAQDMTLGRKVIIVIKPD